MKLILKSVSRRATRCSCGTKDAGELLGAVETSEILFRPNSIRGIANQRLADQEVEGKIVPNKEILVEDHFPRGRTTQRKGFCVVLHSSDEGATARHVRTWSTIEDPRR